MAETVKATLTFLRRSSAFDMEKPYAFRYRVSDSTFSPTNMSFEPVTDICIKDIRGREHDFTLENQGFEVVRLQSTLQYHDFYDDSKLPIYFGELEKTLKQRLGARKVLVFRHGIRKRHAEFPVSTGTVYEYEQPTSIAHVDTTPEELKEEVARQALTDQLALGSGRVEWINVWKPLKGPLNDWPLTVGDASMVDAPKMFEAADLLYENLATENYQVYASTGLEWYYLSDHSPSELMVFTQASNMAHHLAGVPHCSFFNPKRGENESPRESIEARALVFYH